MNQNKTPSGKQFSCRICDYREFREVMTDSIVTEGRHDDTRDTAQFILDKLLIGYECCNCSVMFGDPDLFSK